jgi:hypothetical protein
MDMDRLYHNVCGEEAIEVIAGAIECGYQNICGQGVEIIEQDSVIKIMDESHDPSETVESSDDDSGCRTSPSESAGIRATTSKTTQDGRLEKLLTEFGEEQEDFLLKYRADLSPAQYVYSAVMRKREETPTSAPDFDQIQQALEERLAEAIQIRLPESPKRSRDSFMNTLSVDIAAANNEEMATTLKTPNFLGESGDGEVEMELTMSLSPAQDTPVMRKRVETPTSTPDFDQIQQALEERLAEAIQMRLPESPKRSRDSLMNALSVDVAATNNEEMATTLLKTPHFSGESGDGEIEMELTMSGDAQKEINTSSKVPPLSPACMAVNKSPASSVARFESSLPTFAQFIETTSSGHVEVVNTTAPSLDITDAQGEILDPVETAETKKELGAEAPADLDIESRPTTSLQLDMDDSSKTEPAPAETTETKKELGVEAPADLDIESRPTTSLQLDMDSSNAEPAGAVQEPVHSTPQYLFGASKSSTSKATNSRDTWESKIVAPKARTPQKLSKETETKKEMGAEAPADLDIEDLVLFFLDIESQPTTSSQLDMDDSSKTEPAGAVQEPVHSTPQCLVGASKSSTSKAANSRDTWESKIVAPKARTPQKLSKETDASVTQTLQTFQSRMPAPYSTDQRQKTVVAEEEEETIPTQHALLKRVSLYVRGRRPTIKFEKANSGPFCTLKFAPQLHQSINGCERCLHWASREEQEKFEKEGRHHRIMTVRGGCDRSCAIFPRETDEFPVRLCRRCFYDTHKEEPPKEEWDQGPI